MAVLCVLGVGLVLLAAGRAWGWVGLPASDIGHRPRSSALTGRELTAVPSALAWAALAGLAALAATRGWARSVVGVLLAGFGAGIAAASAGAVRASHLIAVAEGESVLIRAGGEAAVRTSPWWLVSVAGGIVVAAAGLWAAARGRRWPGMSSRYDPPGGEPVARGAGEAAGTAGAVAGEGAADPVEMWRSLDRGTDPTASARPANRTPDATPDDGPSDVPGDMKER